MKPMEKDQGSSTPKELTERQSKHMNRIAQMFADTMGPKFVKGAKEHGGDLQDLPLTTLLDYLEEELIDAYVYLYTVREKIGCQKESTARKSSGELL